MNNRPRFQNKYKRSDPVFNVRQAEPGWGLKIWFNLLESEAIEWVTEAAEHGNRRLCAVARGNNHAEKWSPSEATYLKYHGKGVD